MSESLCALTNRYHEKTSGVIWNCTLFQRGKELYYKDSFMGISILFKLVGNTNLCLCTVWLTCTPAQSSTWIYVRFSDEACGARGPELAGNRVTMWQKRRRSPASLHEWLSVNFLPNYIGESYLLVIINISVLLIMTWVKYLYFANLPFSMT